MSRKKGIAIPLVVLALIVFSIFAGTLLFTSKGEYRLVKKTEDRERARYIAEAGMAVASSLIFQNDFEDRWYKKTIGKYGYTHSIAGEFSGGSYKVRAEDLMNELFDELKNDKEKRIQKLTYKRIDLFSRGTFGSMADLCHSVEITKDGRYAVTSHMGSDIRLWDVASGALVRRFGEAVEQP